MLPSRDTYAAYALTDEFRNLFPEIIAEVRTRFVALSGKGRGRAERVRLPRSARSSSFRPDLGNISGLLVAVGFAQGCLGGGQSCYWNAEGGAAYVIETDLVAELD